MDSPFSPDRAARIRDLFEAVVDLAPEERAEYLENACRDDLALRKEVEALLQAYDRADGVLPGLESALAQATNGYVGQTVSHYEIVSELGRGGMGVVYKATDTRLGRTVAVKFLPLHLSQDPDAKRRFLREARAASSLEHPSICTIYDIGEVDGRSFIVMEYIDGPNLSEKIGEGPFKLDEAVRICVQLLEGLATAHGSGIVHRDIKPANIMLTRTGEVKIMDFGVAKLLGVSSLTGSGKTIGTTTYMSPEQARGERVDPRSDLFSVGVVLYEMITGQKPFKGAAPEAVVHSILNAEPEPLTALRTGVPMRLEWIVTKCLAKDADSRYQTAYDTQIDLRNIDLSDGSLIRSSSSRRTVSAILPGTVPPYTAISATKRGMVTKWLATGFVAGLLVTSAFFMTRSSGRSSTGEPIYSHIDLPDGVTLEPSKSAPLNLERKAVALSPDGQILVIVGSFRETTSLYRRRMSENHFNRMVGTEGAYGVIFSPDGSRVAFYAENRLKIIPIDGGATRDVIPVSLPYNMVWLPGDRILFTNKARSTLEIVSVRGGESEELTVVEKENPDTPLPVRIFPTSILSNGNVIMRSRRFGTYELNIGAMEAASVDEYGTFRQRSPTGHILFQDGVGLSFVASEDPGSIRSSQSAVIVDSLYTRGDPHFEAGTNGTVVFVRGPNMLYQRFNWFSEETGVERLENISANLYGAFFISGDGRSIACVVKGILGSDIWWWDLDRGSGTRLTSAGYNIAPVWTPDGSEIIYKRFAGRASIVLRQAVDQLSAPDTLLHGMFAPEWVTPDGRYLGVTVSSGRMPYDLGYLDLDNLSLGVKMIAATPEYEETLSRLSRSGNFVAYTSNRTGDYEVFVKRFPPTEREWFVSIGGGEEPLWSADDTAIYYRNGDRLLRVNITYSNGDPEFGRPVVVFEEPFENVPGYSIDISSIDNRILMLRDEYELSKITRIDVVTNFPSLLRPIE